MTVSVHLWSMTPEQYADFRTSFGFNAGAQALYEQMGFQVTATQMRRRL